MKKLLLLLFFPIFVFAAQGDVIINEVAWMGTSASANNEWIELLNQSNGDVNLNGWKLETQDGSLKISLAGTISANGFFLLERTDDKTLPEIKADQIYTGALANNGELLILKDANGQEVFRVDGSKGWPAGDAKTKETMQWLNGTWVTAPPTPRAKNVPTFVAAAQKEGITQSNASLTMQTVKASSSPVLSVNPEPVKTVTLNYGKDIIISEFFPNPKGSDENAEWIELYNKSPQDEKIGGFYLDDQEGGSPPYKIPEGTVIKGNSFLVFKRSETKIALNNSQDEVRLLSPTKDVLADISYKDAKEDFAGAYGADKNALYWTRTPTPGKENIITAREAAVSSKEFTKKQFVNSNEQKIVDEQLGTNGSSNELTAQSSIPRSQGQGNNLLFWIPMLGLLALLGVGVYQVIIKKYFE